VVVENIIDAELGYLFTNDYEYLMQRTNIIPVIKNLILATCEWGREEGLIDCIVTFYFGVEE